MELYKFIKANRNWRELLTQPPYSLIIKEDEGYILFKYNQITSDMSNSIVQECRGIILRKDNLKVVRRAFDKFFNYGESNAHSIDWTSARVLEKVDGSLISIWYDDGKWHVSTSGTIDAYKASIGDGSVVRTFGDLFETAIANTWSINKENSSLKNQETSLFWRSMRKALTTTFELVSPLTRIVVPYENTEVYLIGLRNNETQEELDIYDNTLISDKIPKYYELNNLKNCIEAVKAMGYDEEGFVVVDKFFNRVKIKSPAYIQAHYLKNNNIQTTGKLLQMILKGEEDEFLSYFPEYVESVSEIKNTYKDMINELNRICSIVFHINFKEQKQLALFINTHIQECFRGALFTCCKTKESAKDWFNNLSESRQEYLIKNHLSKSPIFLGTLGDCIKELKNGK